MEELQGDVALNPEEVEAAAQEIADEEGYTLPSVKSSLVKVKDVTSKSFGIVVNNAQNEEIVYSVILRNTGVPIEAAKRFFTAVDDQETVLIRIMEAETSEKSIPPEYAIEIGTAVMRLPRGLPADTPVDISFNLNQEGRLKIKAVESTEGRQVDASIETASVIQGEELAAAKVRSQSLVVY